MSISGRRRPRAHSRGFRARPARARPRGREAAPRGRTGRATPSRAIRRRATARQASGDVVARGLAASNAGRDSSGSSSRPARRRTTKLFFKTSPGRESRLGIRSSKLTTVKKSTYEFSRSNQEAGRDLRAQTSDERSLKIAIGAAAAARTRIPNRTSGHLKMNILIGPLDT